MVREGSKTPSRTIFNSIMKKHWFTICLGILLIGVLPYKGIGPSLSRDILFRWITMGWIVSFLVKNRWLQLFFFWGLIRTIILFVTQNVGYTLSNQALEVMTLSFLFYQIAKEKLTVKSLLNIICIVAILQLTAMALQYCNIWIAFYPVTPIKATAAYWKLDILGLDRHWLIITETRARYLTGFLRDCNHVSAFLAICMPAFLRKRWCYLLPALFAGILISTSSTGVVVGFLVIVIFLFNKFRKHGWIVLSMSGVMAISAFLLNISDPMEGLAPRLYVWWIVCSKFIVQHPVIGWGLNQFQGAFPIIHKHALNEIWSLAPWRHTHNELIHMTAELGGIGLAIMVGFLYSTFRKVIRTKNFLVGLGVTAGILASMTTFYFHLPMVMLFLVYLSMLEKGEEYARRLSEYSRKL